ncbi:tetratricopeptide repeat protein [Thiomicrospira microaerophila]|uniref:tetratricopeptide repeat protein n=1 Tax=Thiomicrospira microaerophila TaxID=406020 RepID=UPI00200E13A1|nr:tetratricopeptide repeat protein [Thiomicrospira microaerophila]UQB43032.1 tetratricopeptide repeat protein [Thiomicrospira microaerophila]
MSVLLEALKKAAAEKQQQQTKDPIKNPKGLSLMDAQVSLSDDAAPDVLEKPSRLDASKSRSAFSLEPLDVDLAKSKPEILHHSSSEIIEKNESKPSDVTSSSDRLLESNPKPENFSATIEASKLKLKEKETLSAAELETEEATTESRISDGLTNAVSRDTESPHNEQKTTDSKSSADIKTSSKPYEINEIEANSAKKSWLNPPVIPVVAKKEPLFKKFSTDKNNHSPDKAKAKSLKQFFSKNKLASHNKSVKPKAAQVSERTYAPLIYLLFALTFFVALFYYAFYYYSALQNEYNADVQRLMNMVNAHSEQARSPVQLAVDEAKISVNSELIQEAITEIDTRATGNLGNKKSQLEMTALSQEVKSNLSSVDSEPVAPQIEQQLTKPAVDKPITSISPTPIRVEKTSHTESFSLLAYEAYIQGDFDRAQDLYNRHLLGYPNSRVSKLGLAAIAVHRGHYEKAFNFYQQLLKENSEDKEAKLGIASLASTLAGLGPHNLDLKAILQNNPFSSELQFAVGNVYAKQGDWFRAQQYYFESVRLDNNNANYRINLAISLDHLGDFHSALDHYKHALAIADFHDARFSTDSIKRRVIAIERFLGNHY